MPMMHPHPRTPKRVQFSKIMKTAMSATDMTILVIVAKIGLKLSATGAKMSAILLTNVPTNRQANKRISLEGVQSHAAEPRTAAPSPTHPRIERLKISQPMFHPILVNPMASIVVGQTHAIPMLSTLPHQVMKNTHILTRQMGGIPRFRNM